MDPQAPHTTTFNVLFVCTGNTCRSPMAEAVARREIEARGWTHVATASAGVHAEGGAPASPEAVTAGRGRGLDLSAHAAQHLTPELLAWADLVLAMGPGHVAAVDHMGGADKTALLTEFAARPGHSASGVSDPFGGNEAVYAATLRELEELVRAALDRLEPILQP